MENYRKINKQQEFNNNNNRKKKENKQKYLKRKIVKINITKNKKK